MRLNIVKSKNSESFYITKSYRDKKTKKTTSKIVEKLGTRLELERMLGEDVDIIEWGRARARELTEAEKTSSRKIMVGYDPSKQIEAGVQRLKGGGYLFLQDIYHELGLHNICKGIADSRDFTFDLDAILSRLVFGRILHPTSKSATTEFSKTLIEDAGFDNHQVYRALEVLYAENDAIQSALYKNSEALLARKTKILYFDCTNFFFEITEQDEFREFGHSKQHQPRPLVEMGLFMDAEGIPLAFSMNPGATNEQITMTPLEEKILKDFELSKFIVCTDAGLSSLANRKFNSQGERQFITTQSVKGLKKHLKTWATDPSGWQIFGSDRLYDIDEVAALLASEETDPFLRDTLYQKTFYKCRRIKEKDPKDATYFEQNFIITFSFKYRAYQRAIREGQIERALKALSSPTSKLDKKSQNDYRRFIKTIAHTDEGEICEKVHYSINEETITKEAAFDGFYGLATSLDNSDIEGIIAVSQRRWQIEECFRIMKHEFKARPVFLSKEERICAHFLTCFIALLVYRILEKNLGDIYTCTQIIETLAGMLFEEIKGEGYRPLYVRTDITDALHDAFGFRTDYEIISNRDMKKIIQKTKRR